MMGGHGGGEMDYQYEQMMQMQQEGAGYGGFENGDMSRMQP